MQSLTPAFFGIRALILILSQPFTEQKANLSLSLWAFSLRNSSLQVGARPLAAALEPSSSPSSSSSSLSKDLPKPPPLDPRASQHGQQAVSVSGRVRSQGQMLRDKARSTNADPSLSPRSTPCDAQPQSHTASHLPLRRS